MITIIRIAEINIKINHSYKYIPALCKDYIYQGSDYDFEINITEDEILDEINKSTEYDFPKWYAEGIVCYRKICHELYRFDAIMIHSSAISYQNECYLFTARSGTGKTTHTRLLYEYLKGEVKYVNGDKPIIRRINNIFYVYGTPWNGKENLGENVKVPLKALVFLERSEHNSVTTFDKKDLIKKIIPSIIMPTGDEEVNKTFNILSDVIDAIDTYTLKCNMDIEAAVVSSKEILKKRL